MIIDTAISLSPVKSVVKLVRRYACGMNLTDNVGTIG